jgi:hypothetical protein
VPDDLYQPYNGNFAGVYQKFATGGTHFVAAHAKELHIRSQLTQRLNQLRAIVFAGGLACREQNLHHVRSLFSSKYVSLGFPAK